MIRKTVEQHSLSRVYLASCLLMFNSPQWHVVQGFQRRSTFDHLATKLVANSDRQNSSVFSLCTYYTSQPFGDQNEWDCSGGLWPTSYPLGWVRGHDPSPNKIEIRRNRLVHFRPSGGKNTAGPINCFFSWIWKKVKYKNTLQTRSLFRLFMSLLRTTSSWTFHDGDQDLKPQTAYMVLDSVLATVSRPTVAHFTHRKWGRSTISNGASPSRTYDVHV